MRIPSLLIAALLLAPNLWAQEERPFYVQLGFGGVASESISGTTSDFDPGYSASVAVGRKFHLSKSFDFEAQVEGNYQYLTFEEVGAGFDDTVKSFAVMVNGIFDWSFTQQYSMYGGLGVGYAPTIEYGAFDGGSLSTSDNTGFAYQGLFGFAYNMGGTYDVRLGYRYFRTETITVTDAVGSIPDFDIDVGRSALELTFRWAL